MTSHGSVAASVRKSKAAHPEKYCRASLCLWRTSDRFGNPTPCPRHTVPAASVPANELLGLLEQSVDATAEGAS